MGTLSTLVRSCFVVNFLKSLQLQSDFAQAAASTLSHFIAMPCLRDIIVGSYPTRPHKYRCIYYTHTCTHEHGATKITTLGEAIHYRTGTQSRSPPIHDSARELQAPTRATVTIQKHPWFDFSYGPSMAQNKPMDSTQNWIQHLGAIIIITKWWVVENFGVR